MCSHIVAIVQLLVEAGADQTRTNKDGKTPMLLVCEKERADLIQILLCNAI